MKQLTPTENLLAGLQWLFFMFTNTVVIPLTVSAAFQLSQGEMAVAVQRSFIFTGLACIMQVLFGHRLPIMEGQTGLWWGVILNLCASAAAAQISLPTLGGSLTVGIIIGGIAIIIIGITGIGQKLAGIFTPVVMSVFLFLLGVQLTTIFFKGMLGLTGTAAEINLPVAALSIFIALLTGVLTVKGSASLSRFAMLIGIVIGWVLFVLLLPGETVGINHGGNLFGIYPWGAPAWDAGVILMAVVVGLCNVSNTVGALKGAEPFYDSPTTGRQYRASFALTGVFSIISGLFGMVPYAPYVSSLGFLSATRILERAPFLIGAGLFMLIGLIPPLGDLLATLPLSIGDAVLFVAYLQMFGTALQNIQRLEFNYKTIFRVAAPLALGIAVMNLSPAAFTSLPAFWQPLLRNGILVGIVAALMIENLINWEKV